MFRSFISSVIDIFSHVVALVILAIAALCAFALLAWAGYTETHLRCEGSATIKYQEGDRVYPGSRAGLTVHRYRWFAFWADKKQTVNYRVILNDPEYFNVPRGELFLPLWGVNSTFFSTEVSKLSAPQVYHDNVTGYATIIDNDDSLPMEFDGFCDPFEPAF